MIGILGGMGPRATIPFLDSIIDYSHELYGAKLDEDFPKMMVLFLPTPFYIDRPIDHKTMEATIKGGLKQLESTNVRFISMPCNGAHIYYDELSKSLSVPLLNIVEETLAQLTSYEKITILATKMMMDSKMYQKRFENAGIEFIFISHWQNFVDEIIKNIKCGNITESISIFKSLIKEIELYQIKRCIIACTDISFILPRIESKIRFIDSTKSLAKATVQKYYESLSK